MKMDFEKYIPDNLIQEGIDLKEIVGGEVLAWNYENIMKIIDILGKKKIVILGGDIIDKNLNYNYDNWYYNGGESKESIEKAKNYVENYHKNIGNDYYYILVINDNE